MSTSPHRGRARSPQRSPGASPRNSPKRRPLHERSDSQANEQVLPDYFDPKLLSHHPPEPGRVYAKDPFPTLPSQVLTPSGGFPIFEDSTATVEQENVVVTRPPSSPRHVRTKSEKGKARRKPSPERPARTSLQSVDLPPPSNRPSHSASLVSLRKQQLEALDAAVRRAEQIRAEQLASRASMRPLPSSQSSADEARDRAFLARYQSLVLDRFAPGSKSSVQLPVSESYFERPRSRASSFTLSRPASQRSRKSEERPRSASQPVAASADADLSALLSEGIEVQYAKIQQPSMTSLRSESSSTRRIYPAPLRLKRKRAEDMLARQQATPPLTRKNSPRLRSEPSFASSISESGRQQQSEGSTTPGPQFAVDFPESPDMDLSLTLPEQAHISASYPDELGDTLGELYAPGLRPQRSGYFSEKGQSSRPDSIRSVMSQASTTSLATHRHFLTFFLNDSHTTWAQKYYGGKARLYLEAPSVVNLNALQRPCTPRVSIEPEPSNWDTISGMSSSSYSSSDYPSQIYIPRIRAFRGAHSSQYLPQDGSRHESRHVSESFSYTTGDEPSVREASQGIRQQARSWHPSADYYGPNGNDNLAAGFDPTNLGEIPHLRTDRNVGFSIYSLRTPSLDRYEPPWGPVNRQYWMLLIGFIFPISWMVAACLPIPTRPNWRRNSASSPPVPDIEEDVTDLWNSQEVRRYQKARRWRVFNRFMSMFGFCVIGVVIAFAIIGSRS